MNFALRTAENSESRQRHAALVVRAGRVLAVGINVDKNHPTILEESVVKHKASVHAEVRALRRVVDATGCTLYVARAMRCGRAGNSKPCSNCDTYIRSRGVKRVIYT